MLAIGAGRTRRRTPPPLPSPKSPGPFANPGENKRSKGILCLRARTRCLKPAVSWKAPPPPPQQAGLGGGGKKGWERICRIATGGAAAAVPAGATSSRAIVLQSVRDETKTRRRDPFRNKRRKGPIREVWANQRPRAGSVAPPPVLHI